ncbi:hypothetical protein AAG570_004043 [Ranatra chinensis]|uniref:G-protein coupled receptors family 3 profile domain-containing protein n=1 Tax=Ranatra chinensis TaxID=642074 RepID=A0ABD0Y2Z6_9HEMI
MALALNATQRTTDITKFNYGRKDMVKSLFRNMATLKFTGVSGPIAFNGPDRVGITAFYQVQKGEARTVGLYDATQRLLELPCAGCLSPVWQGGQVPIAERKFKLRIVTIEPAAFLTISCLASVGITLAIMFLVFNLHFRKLKYIKLSSPKMNNMAVVGCILVYTAVILLGLDNATLRPDAFPIVCTARVYLLSAGFSMAFGSMFTKTYRVHRIFTRSSSSVVKNKMLQDTQLISLICVLLVVDGLIVTLWVTFDPMERHLRNLSLEISSTDRSVVYQPQVEECGSQYTHSWLGVLYAYKGLLLIVGVYMAWETRHVKIPALNDSKYIGLSVYSAVITSVLVVVFANLISERATMAFLTITALILVSTTTSLCILFIPKIHAIMAHTDRSTTIDPIMQSMGLKIEYNTRRFVTDDRREVHYRVEVQNRVYKRDLLTLDNEISKLEKQLYNCTSDASSRSSIALKGEMEEGLDRLSVAGGGRGKSPSVSGGIPMLLLSVLPPVIPRASWPSSENCVQPPSRNLAFNSEPKLDQTKQFIYFPRGSRHQSIGCTEDKESSVFAKFLNVIAPRSSRKSSGIASALRAHMGYMAGIIPPTEGGAAKQRDDEEEGSGRCLSQPRVSFSVGDKVGTGSGSSVFKERPKGSPRFPHRIVPTSSLNDLGRRGGGGPRGRRDSKWRSLEDASLSPTADLWPQPQQEPSLLAPNHR